MLSLPQQTVLKIFYGLPLKTQEELNLWSAFQGYGEYDELGYLLGVSVHVPYVPKEYHTLTGIIGRRSGKSDRIGGLSAAYEITLGGHTGVNADTGIQQVREGQEAYWLYIAQDLQTAETNMKFVTLALQTSKYLSSYIVKNPKGTISKDEVEIKNGIILRPEPPNIRTGRGVPVVGVTMDEFAFWYKNAKSANPDFEVVNALDYSLQQFSHAKQLRLSTPWTKEGLHYAASVHGTEGMNLTCGGCRNGLTCTHMAEERAEHEGHLVIKSPTATMGNPLMTRKKFARLRKKNPEAFKRESLAQFTDTQSTFLSWALVESAVEKKVYSRSRITDADYVAALDPAFRNDSFTMNIVHHEKYRGIVQDFIQEWIPEPGEKLNPGVILDEVKKILAEWQLDMVYSDQHQLESLQVLAEDREFTIIGMDLTTKSKTKMMKNIESVFNQRKVKLLDNSRQEAQLKSLIKTRGPSGYESVAAPVGKLDDLAMVFALAATKALEIPPLETEKPGTAATKGIRFTPETQARLKAQFDQRERDDPSFADHRRRMQLLLELYGDD